MSPAAARRISPPARVPLAAYTQGPADLGPLQRDLLKSALAAVRPGGVVAYVTCSPHPAETTAVVTYVLRKRDDLELLDAGAGTDGVSLTGNLGAGHGLTAQLWPHVHSTDAMFLLAPPSAYPPASVAR